MLVRANGSLSSLFVGVHWWVVCLALVQITCLYTFALRFRRCLPGTVFKFQFAPGGAAAGPSIAAQDVYSVV